MTDPSWEAKRARKWDNQHLEDLRQQSLNFKWGTAANDYIEALETHVAELEEETEQALRFETDITTALSPLGVWYMDPPDGGNVSKAEFLQRAVADLLRLRDHVRKLEASLENARKDWRVAYARLEKEDARVAHLEAALEALADAMRAGLTIRDVELAARDALAAKKGNET